MWKKREYLRWIRKHGWSLDKAGKDWKLRNEHGKTVVPNIIVTHDGEVPPIAIKKTKAALVLAGKEKPDAKR